MSTHTKIINYIGSLLPKVRLEVGNSFSWSPGQQLITYKADSLNNLPGQWAILHEAAHALQNHSNYTTDFDLLNLEVAAWDKARNLAEDMDITIDEDHIQDCLDTYREWLHRRSTCPNCGVVCLQSSTRSYSCHNCYTNWTVSASRFCRPYRLRSTSSHRKRSRSNTATFS